MRFARHETFHFREGWLTKGFRKIESEGFKDLFSRPDAMELLGIGNNMVRSLRYWMQATGLTQEPKKGKKTQELTDFGRKIYELDRYLEEEVTLWLLHYKLASSKEMATTWFWFFNVFGHREFDEEIFIGELETYLKEAGEEIARGSLKKDFDCLINTYLNSSEFNANPENNIGCPLQELGIIELIDSKRKLYRVTKRDLLRLPKEVFLYGIIDFSEQKNSKELSIDSLLNDEGSIGKIFTLGLGDLIAVLESLQSEGYLRFSRTAGLNLITLTIEDESLQVLDNILYQAKDRGYCHEL